MTDTGIMQHSNHSLKTILCCDEISGIPRGERGGICSRAQHFGVPNWGRNVTY